MKILIAEDEIALQQSIATYLQADANVCEVASKFKDVSCRGRVLSFRFKNV